MTRPKYPCPACGQESGVAIVYGLPAPDLWEAGKRKEVSLGGCVMFPGQPQFHCMNCDHKWRSDGEEPVFEPRPPRLKLISIPAIPPKKFFRKDTQAAPKE